MILNQQALDLIRWAVSLFVPALAGLFGVLVGAWLTARRDKASRQLSFVENQLTRLYSPMVGIRNEIRMLSELRLKISQSADKNWRRLCEEAREQGGVKALRERTDERKDQFGAIITYNNQQLMESLIPSYRRMVELFRENYYLAEPETREHFKNLLEFVDLWERWLQKTIPNEVLEDLDHGETILLPFYEHLKKTHDELRLKLKEGKA